MGARDPSGRRQAVAVPLFEDARFRCQRFDFQPGAQTGWHVHGHDYVITTITPCTMLLEEPGGRTRTVTLAAGESYARTAGVEHNVVNGGDVPMSFVELEVL